MTYVLLTHAPEEEARAALVAEKLGALGYEVLQDADIFRPLSPFERRRLKSEIEKAGCVLVLWSREAAESPSLVIAAQQAKALGKLAVARMDSAVVPAGLTLRGAANLSNWIGRDTTRAWRQLVTLVGATTNAKSAAPKAAAKPAATPAAPTPRLTSFAAVDETAPPKKKGGGAGLAIALIVLLLAAAGAGAYFFLL